MIVKLNNDPDAVFAIKSSLKENGGYCPCQPLKNEDTKCMCKDFKDKLEDPNFQGECFCGLYIKELSE